MFMFWDDDPSNPIRFDGQKERHPAIGLQEFCSPKADVLTRETASSSSSPLGERTAPETTDGLRRG